MFDGAYDKDTFATKEDDRDFGQKSRNEDIILGKDHTLNTVDFDNNLERILNSKGINLNKN